MFIYVYYIATVILYIYILVICCADQRLACSSLRGWKPGVRRTVRNEGGRAVNCVDERRVRGALLRCTAGTRCSSEINGRLVLHCEDQRRTHAALLG